MATTLPNARHHNPRFVYFFTPFLKTISLFSRRFFQKILSLCMVSIQERFPIKSDLWWRMYGTERKLLYFVNTPSTCITQFPLMRFLSYVRNAENRCTMNDMMTEIVYHLKKIKSFRNQMFWIKNMLANYYVFLIEKKIWKIWVILDIEHWLWKSDFWWFSMNCHSFI